MKKIMFGRINMRIMQVLWDKKRANAREITEMVNEFEPVAHSTIQTYIRHLENKGAVAHDVEDRTFIYFPLIENETVMKYTIRDFVDLIFSGSAESLVSYLAKNKYITQKEVEKIFELTNKEE